MFSWLFQVRIALVLLWLIAIGTGFAMILNYQTTGGETGRTPDLWPAKTQAVLNPAHNTLIMFAHPQCPCTRASLQELNHLLAQVQDRVSAEIFFYRPRQFSEDWTKTDLWRSAMAIPGVIVHEDIDGLEAGLFGAKTSGSVFLYDPQGRLLYQGGITGSRGHAGDNGGENAVISLCRGQEADLNQAAVYGCSLLSKCKTQTEQAAK